MAIVDIGGAGRVRMLLDTGARRSWLTGRFAVAFPGVVENAPSEKRTFGGAGGSHTADVRVLRNVTVVADGQSRKVDSITVSSDTKRDEHGAPGQDVLRADGGFALDFRTLDFVLLPAR